MSKTTNENPSSSKNAKDPLWKNLFGDKWGKLLLGGGLFLLLCNVVAIFGIDIRPNAWLYYLDMRYWSVYFSLFLWVTAVWLASKLTDIAGNHLPLVRLFVITGMLLVIFFALRDAFGVVGSTTQDHPFGVDAAIIVVSFCVVRSLFLFYSYRSEGSEAIDLEETQWFWGLSGFLFTGLVSLGIMSIVPVKKQVHTGMDSFVTESLLKSCSSGLQALVQSGTGSLSLRIFGLLIFIAAIAFIYVAGKWALIFLHKIREEWE